MTQPSTQDVAKDEAAGVASRAGDAGRQVTDVAREEAGNVAGEARRQTEDLVGQAREEVTRQAGEQQQRLAATLRSLGSELDSMTERSDQDGMASDLARQAAERAHEAAGWLEDRDPGSLVQEVKGFARRRPGTFLAIAVGAGLVAGRLTRGLKDDASSATPVRPTPAPRPTPVATPTTATSPGYGAPVTGPVAPFPDVDGPLGTADVSPTPFGETGALR